jgi:monovalent cation/proton antiporter MnhG/PhaG subunit
VRSVLTNVFLWLGVGCLVLSSLGVVIMRDVFARLHFSSPGVLGVVCVSIAVVIKDSFSLIGDQAVLIALFVLVTAPVLTHSVARAARIDSRDRWELDRDEGVEIEDP